MIKKVVIFWLWWQWKQFLSFFIKNRYKVFWVCKTQKTKMIIESMYNIKVFTNYRKILNNNIDLLVLSAYPIGIYQEVIQYSKSFQYKILSDLPVTFEKSFFEHCTIDDKLYLFLLEAKLPFFEATNLYNNREDVNIIEITLFQNKQNLSKQKYKKESIIVDLHYAFCNILWLMFEKVKFNFSFINREIKDVEYIIRVIYKEGKSNILRYEEGSCYFYEYNNWILQSKLKERIVFDDVLSLVLEDIEQDKNLYKKEYFRMLSYLCNKLNYEKH